MTKVTIRKTHVTNAAPLAELSEVLGYPVEPDVIKRRLERLLSRPEHVVLVAESPRGEVVGWTHAAEQDILEVGRYCEIVGLVVAADQRGHGIGWRLVERIEQWASEPGRKQVSVRSNAARPESHPFYERLGFARVKTQHAYRKHIRSARRPSAGGS
jgi:GNAT superfamily N-acetyltransferase